MTLSQKNYPTTPRGLWLHRWVHTGQLYLPSPPPPLCRSYFMSAVMVAGVKRRVDFAKNSRYQFSIDSTQRGWSVNIPT